MDPIVERKQPVSTDKTSKETPKPNRAPVRRLFERLSPNNWLSAMARRKPSTEESSKEPVEPEIAPQKSEEPAHVTPSLQMKGVSTPDISRTSPGGEEEESLSVQIAKASLQDLETMVNGSLSKIQELATGSDLKSQISVVKEFLQEDMSVRDKLEAIRSAQEVLERLENGESGVGRTAVEAAELMLKEFQKRIQAEIKAVGREQATHYEAAKTSETKGPEQTYIYRDGNWVIGEPRGGELHEMSRPHNFLTFRGTLPPGCSEWRPTRKSAVLTHDEFYWLGDGSYKVPLDEVEITHSGQAKMAKKEKVYIGTCFDDKVEEFLTAALSRGHGTKGGKSAADLAGSELHEYERLFFLRLIEHLGGNIKKFYLNGSVDGGEASNGEAGARVYFATPGRLDGKNVFIVVGSGHKSTQGKLTRVIGTF